MGKRESIYRPLGYDVHYKDVEKCRGFGTIKICLAKKDGKTFFGLSDPAWYTKIMEAQDSIPHMAKFAEPADRHILLESAGTLIWNLDEVAFHTEIENQLTEFANAANTQRLIHGDIRPWNVFLTNGEG